MVFDKVIDIVASELNVSKDELSLETHIEDDLGADSLDAVELMMALEDEFSVNISDEEAQKFRTIDDIVSYLKKELV